MAQANPPSQACPDPLNILFTTTPVLNAYGSHEPHSAALRLDQGMTRRQILYGLYTLLPLLLQRVENWMGPLLLSLITDRMFDPLTVHRK